MQTIKAEKHFGLNLDSAFILYIIMSYF